MSETSTAAGPRAGEAPPDPTRASRDRAAQPGYFRIENDFVDCYAERIGAIPVAVRVVLGRFADNKTRRCYPSIRKIAEILHLSQKTVLKAIRVLEEEGLVRVERRRTTRGERLVNVYTLPPIRGAPLFPTPVLNDVQHCAGGDTAEQDLINKTQENKGEARPPAHPPGASSSDPKLDHPAVKAYRELVKLTPNEAQRTAIVATVSDIRIWREVIEEWLLADWRKQNVAGMLDRYRKTVAERTGSNGRNARSGRPGFQGNKAYDRRESRPPETPEERASLDAEWDMLKQSQNRSQHEEG